MRTSTMANRGLFLTLLVAGILGALDARWSPIAYGQGRAVSRMISNPFQEPMFKENEQRAMATLMKLKERVSFFDSGGLVSVHLGSTAPNETIGSLLRQISVIHT